MGRIFNYFKDFFGPVMSGWNCPKCGELNFYRDNCRICGYELKEGVDF